MLPLIIAVISYKKIAFSQRRKFKLNFIDEIIPILATFIFENKVEGNNVNNFISSSTTSSI
jgi:hypothetical protein